MFQSQFDSSDDDMLAMGGANEHKGMHDFGVSSNPNSALQVRDMMQNLDELLKTVENQEVPKEHSFHDVSATSAASAASASSSLSKHSASSSAAAALSAVAGVPSWLSDLRSKIAALSPPEKEKRPNSNSFVAAAAVAPPSQHERPITLPSTQQQQQQPQQRQQQQHHSASVAVINNRAAMLESISNNKRELGVVVSCSSALTTTTTTAAAAATAHLSTLLPFMPLDISARPSSLQRLVRRGVRVVAAPPHSLSTTAAAFGVADAATTALTTAQPLLHQQYQRIPETDLQQQHEVSLSTDAMSSSTSSSCSDSPASDQQYNNTAMKKHDAPSHYRRHDAPAAADESVEIIDVAGHARIVVDNAEESDDSDSQKQQMPAQQSALSKKQQQQHQTDPVVVQHRFMQPTDSWKHHIDPEPRHIRVESLTANDSSVVTSEGGTAVAAAAASTSSARRGHSTSSRRSSSCASDKNPRQQNKKKTTNNPSPARRLGPLPTNNNSGGGVHKSENSSNKKPTSRAEVVSIVPFDSKRNVVDITVARSSRNAAAAAPPSWLEKGRVLQSSSTISRANVAILDSVPASRLARHF